VKVMNVKHPHFVVKQTEKCVTLIKLLVSDKCVLSYATLITCHVPIWIVHACDIWILLPVDCNRSVRKYHLNWHTDAKGLQLGAQ